MAISKASATWDGGFKDGRGAMRPAHAPEAAFTAGSRFEGQPSSNPEELIGAALSGCFSMALAVALERAGHPPRHIETQAEVQLEKKPEGFTITTITLRTTAEVPGVDQDTFGRIAEETKKTCPVSRALAGTTINLQARLDS